MRTPTVLAASLALVMAPLTLAALPATAAPPAADDHPLGDLAPTPPMGWNSWNTFGCDINEQLIRDTADALVASGMRDAGYEYVNIDDCWMAPERDADGRLQPDPVDFPHGIAAIADYVHARGLKLGIYSSAGTATCQGLPASLGHEEIDAQSFADWGVDYLKYDNCNNQGVPAIERYQAMGDALAATGRDIVYSICEWGTNDPWLWGRDVGGHLWRTTGDITDRWDSVMSLLDQQVGLEAYSGPNGWNDPDMLEVGNDGLTRTESRAHMSLWALLNAPLIAGNDVRDMEPWVLDQLTDPDVVAIDQDWGGEQGSKLRDDGDAEVWSKPMSDGSVAVVLLNRGGNTQTVASTARDLGLRSSKFYSVRDVWADTTRTSGGTIRASVGSHAAEMYIVSAARAPSHPPLVSLDAAAPYYTAVGEQTTVTTTVYNDGATAISELQLGLDVPAGWTATQDGSPRPSLPPGESTSVDWTLSTTNPEAGRVDVEASASWLSDEVRDGATQQTSFLQVEPIPTGQHYLSDLEWMEASSFWGPVERDMSNGEQAGGDGGPITIAGTTYEKGLGVHAPSTVTYFAAGDCATVAAQVGIDDETNSQGDVIFELWGDGQQLASSGVVSGGDPAVPLSADLAGVDVLQLRVLDNGGPNYDHADWADAQITCS
ncbi:MAG TPA: NPCBM/NEW2 domain-containing protein [Nocardioidaceae bacterium]|nr:NPCBM/NEW2 domain-containing protein [Nocardioidaceae bacterium]